MKGCCDFSFCASTIPVQEPGWAARVRGAAHRVACKGAGVRCLLHAEPEEGGIVGGRELKADAAVDHRYGIRVQGEGCEGCEVGGLEEVDLHLHVTCLVQTDGVIR